MKKKRIKIKFVDLQSIDYKQFIIYHILKEKYDIEISDTPDYIIYGDSGYEHLKYNCIRIYYTGENKVPNFNQCDYGMGFSYIEFEDRYFRMPLFIALDNYIKTYNLGKEKHKNKQNFIIRSKFCNMVVSNGLSQTRLDFFKKLSEYKIVDSGGKILNNVGGPVPNKLEFQKKYKFSIAFENSVSNGYSTEKIIDAFASGGIPIYYGDPKINLVFNKKAFINYQDFNSEEDLIEYIKKVDNDDKLYMQYIKEPMLINENYFEDIIKDLKSYLYNIFEQPLEKAQRRCPKVLFVEMERKYYLLSDKIVKMTKPFLKLKTKIKNKLIK